MSFQGVRSVVTALVALNAQMVTSLPLATFAMTAAPYLFKRVEVVTTGLDTTIMSAVIFTITFFVRQFKY